MKKIVFLLLSLCFFADGNAALLLAKYQKLRQISDKDYQKMVVQDSIDAIAGIADAQYRYGLVCFFERDRNTGIEYLRKSAAQNHPQGIGAIAEILYFGDGISRNQTEAYYMFEKAAALYDTLSIYYLGVCNYYGHGTNKDYNKAVKYFNVASSSSSSLIKNLGLNYLSKCYRYGRGVERNPAISNLIILENYLDSSVGQVALSSLCYDKKLTQSNQRDILCSLYGSSSMENRIMRNIERVQKRYTDILNSNDVQPQLTSFQNDQKSEWKEALITAIKAEQDAASEPLKYENTMLDLEKTQIDERLQRIASDLEFYKQLCPQEPKGDNYLYYHLVSIDGEDVEICDENQVRVDEKGIEYVSSKNVIPVLTFETIKDLSELKFVTGKTRLSISKGESCEIIVSELSDFTYKVIIQRNSKITTMVISNKCNSGFVPAPPTFGLG